MWPMIHIQILPLFGHVLTERLKTGLAPDIPEDLYMLIKKVRLPFLPLCSFLWFYYFTLFSVSRLRRTVIFFDSTDVFFSR